MSSSKQLCRALTAILSAVSFTASPAASAQTLGGVTGAVVDESGAAVVGAMVTIVDSRGKARPAISTDTNGNFAVADVPLGRHTIQVEKAQFQVSRFDFDVTDNLSAEPWPAAQTIREK